MLLEDALAEFLNARQAAGKRPKTIRFYSDNIRSYLSFLQENQHNSITWTQPRTFDDYFNHERSRGLSDSSINARYRALRAFFNWLGERKYIEESPLATVEEPSYPFKPPKRIPLDAFRHLVASIPKDGASWLDYRDRLIIEMLFWTGLRAGEIVALRLEDVDQDHCLLCVDEAKNRRSRYVPFPDMMNAAFKTYLVTRPPIETTHLYVSSDGMLGAQGRLTVSGLVQMLIRRCKAAGLPTYRPHSFRHGFAMAMLNTGRLEIGILARLLGHSSPTLTEKVYAEWETASLKRAYDFAEQAIGYDLDISE